MKNTRTYAYEISHKELISLIETYILSKDPSADKIVGSKLEKTLKVSGVSIPPSSGASIVYLESLKETN